MEPVSNVMPVDFSRTSRKESLKTIHAEIKLLGDEDLARVGKLLKAELKSRTALADLQAEIDE